MSSSLSLVTVQFADDYSGANADVQMEPNGSNQPVTSLLQNTSVGTGGFIDSVALQSNFEGITLIVKNANQEIARASGNADNVARFQRVDIADLTVEVSNI